jgi:epoxyqueuosine reductase QueG
MKENEWIRKKCNLFPETSTMKETISTAIENFVADYQRQEHIRSSWGGPLVGFADAADPLFPDLKQVVSPTHAVPQDILVDARTVIAFFLPFPKSLATTNTKERMSSREWAIIYIETNELIASLSEHLQQFFEKLGASSRTIPATHNWDEKLLISNWSHRHIAYIAGLGNFGLNNMLITEKGCCGRVGSLVTAYPVEADVRRQTPSCLYKFDGSCRKCVRKCVNEALTDESFDRFRCYAMLQNNVDGHTEVGYADVCGKCQVAVPCSHNDPVARKLRKVNQG